VTSPLHSLSRILANKGRKLVKWHVYDLWPPPFMGCEMAEQLGKENRGSPIRRC
jgi:hypothetical protein